MTRSMLVRIVEAFFRRWYLYVIPFLALVTLGIMDAGGSTDYTSHGTLFVDRGSLITARTGIGGQGVASYLSPAQFASQELNGLLLTDVFTEAVLEDAGIELADDPSLRAEQTAIARGSISTVATSENLLLVRVTTDDPETSAALAQGTINGLIDFKIELDTADSTAAGSFFSELLEKYEKDVIEARTARDAYIQSTSVRSIDQLTPAQKTEYDRLSAEEALAAGRYDTALDDLEASRLAELQAETDVRQSNSVVDPPQAASQPNAQRLADTIVTIALFAVVGFVLTIVGPVVAALLDRSVLLPEDLDHVADGGVIAVVPSVSKKDGRLPADQVWSEVAGTGGDDAKEDRTEDEAEANSGTTDGGDGALLQRRRVRAS